jgi:hypothetical protein
VFYRSRGGSSLVALLSGEGNCITGQDYYLARKLRFGCAKSPSHPSTARVLHGRIVGIPDRGFSVVWLGHLKKGNLRIQATSTIESDGLRSGRGGKAGEKRDRNDPNGWRLLVIYFNAFPLGSFPSVPRKGSMMVRSSVSDSPFRRRPSLTILLLEAASVPAPRPEAEGLQRGGCIRG